MTLHFVVRKPSSLSVTHHDRYTPRDDGGPDLNSGTVISVGVLDEGDPVDPVPDHSF